LALLGLPNLLKTIVKIFRDINPGRGIRIFRGCECNGFAVCFFLSTAKAQRQNNNNAKQIVHSSVQILLQKQPTTSIFFLQSRLFAGDCEHRPFFYHVKGETEMGQIVYFDSSKGALGRESVSHHEHFPAE